MSPKSDCILPPVDFLRVHQKYLDVEQSAWRTGLRYYKYSDCEIALSIEMMHM